MIEYVVMDYDGEPVTIEDGRKEVLSIELGENESAKYWLGVLNSLKNRGLRDILILCADGLTGLQDAIATAFPQTEFRRCILFIRSGIRLSTWQLRIEKFSPPT